MRVPTIGVALALALLGAAPCARAEESQFGYVYTTDTLPRGKWEVEQWLTDRDGQAQGHYHGLEGRSEFEYGLRDNLQVSLYWNYSYVNANRNSVRGLTEGIDIKASHDPRRSYSNLHNDGFSAEVVWRVLSPYKDPIGLAFYVEPFSGPKEYGVETRAILQKNFYDDRIVLAANAWVEFEREAGTNIGSPGNEEQAPDGAKTDATYGEIDLGASYRFRPKWSVGLEFRNHNEWGGFTLDHADQDHTAFFLGPTLHYGGERWWFTLTAMRQLGAVPYSEEQRAQIYRGLLYGNEHTSWDGIRLRVGREF